MLSSERLQLSPVHAAVVMAALSTEHAPTAAAPTSRANDSWIQRGLITGMLY
jgi:hypothetical protein